jgi:2-polyprenyl-3-methyl-5-hydroxy-6-metoxy-1,4-benzoquinol methylase
LGVYRSFSFRDSSLAEVLDEERSYPNSTIDAERMVRTARELAGKGRFLDVGAGYGFASRRALDEGFEVDALDPSPASCRVFEEMNGFKPEAAAFDDAFAAARRGTYDVVLLNQVIEHVLDPENVARNIAAVLKPGGIAAIGVPHFGGSLVSRVQGKKDMLVCPPVHLTYYTKLGMRSLFARMGLGQVAVNTVSRFDKKRIARRLRVPFLGRVAAEGIHRFVESLDLVGAGMYFNAYFRKPHADSA